MEKSFIDLESNSYYIYIEEGILNYLADYIGNADKYLIIFDKNVEKYYGDRVYKSLEGKVICSIILTPGENTKTMNTVENILSQMVEFGLTRKSKIIAVGGGVVGDISGFCASIYMRGIPFIQVPTTLLSQVDSSVGGKTGVNMPQGKNLIGSFYQPETVIIDINTLKTLDRREVISGLGEVIKYGIIWDYDFFNNIKTHILNILEGEGKQIKVIIKRCCEIKAKIVSEDEKELGIRKILNYGHTIGHGLESITNYGKYTHGEAVILGMYYEAFMARNLGYIEEDYFMEIENLIKNLNLSLDIKELDMEQLVKAMLKDKKNKEGKISFILPIGKGKVEEKLFDKIDVVSELNKIK